eukprot:1157366-Pelagomonas_calceolata.AAC.3
MGDWERRQLSGLLTGGTHEDRWPEFVVDSIRRLPGLWKADALACSAMAEHGAHAPCLRSIDGAA